MSDFEGTLTVSYPERGKEEEEEKARPLTNDNDRDLLISPHSVPLQETSIVVTAAAERLPIP